SEILHQGVYRENQSPAASRYRPDRVLLRGKRKRRAAFVHEIRGGPKEIKRQKARCGDSPLIYPPRGAVLRTRWMPDLRRWSNLLSVSSVFFLYSLRGRLDNSS